MPSKAEQALNFVVDTLEKCSTPGTRAGNLVERVGKMDASGVPRKVIALLMTDRSTCNINWTEEKVGVLSDAYRESQTRALITASQATALMDECARHDDRHTDALPLRA